MRRFGSVLAASAVVALVCASAFAQEEKQQRRGPGGFGGFGGAMLLTNKSVQEELKLEAEQVEKVTKIANEQRDKAREAMQGFQDLTPEQRREKFESFQNTSRREVFQALREAVKPEQARRFMQIDLQQRGVAALNSTWIAQRLNLNDDQKAKIKAIVEEQPAKMREIMQAASGDFAAAREKMVALRKDAIEKAAAVLTAEQKENWTKMLGEPFEVKFERRGQ